MSRKFFVLAALSLFVVDVTPGLTQTVAPPPKVAIGIGNITNTYDNTSESFNLLAFLKARPVQPGLPAIEFLLIDHPSDADYVISGKVGALYDHKMKTTLDRRRGDSRPRMHGDTPSGPAAQKAHEFTYSHDFDLTIWKAGKKLGAFHFSVDGPHPGVPDEVVKSAVGTDNYDGIRMKLLSPAWNELATRLDQQLQQDFAPDKEGGKMRFYITTVLLSVSLLSGCVQHQPIEILPKQATYDSDALERKEPVVRYADFERQYREGVYQDPYWPLEAKYEGLGQLIMPPSVRPEAAWGYVSLGKDFAAQGDYGGAARSYWAALELVSRTIASRPDRERIVRAAYEGLEEVAKVRGQRKWERLMRFCSRLADTYLASSQAEADNAAFYTQMDVIKKAQQEMEVQKSQANRQLLVGMLVAASAGVGAAGAVYSGNPSALRTYTTQGLTQAIESKINYQEVAEKIKEISEKQNAQYKTLRVAVANDAEEITAGNSFVANEFLFYLDNA